MGHHDDGKALGTVEIRQGVVHIVGGRRIKARHRLVQDQQFSGGAQGPGQQHPLLLTAGQLTVAPVFQFQHPQLSHVHQRPGSFRRRVEKPSLPGTEKPGEHHLVHRGGKVPLGTGLLGQIADGAGAQGLVPHDLPLHRLEKAQQRLQQRGFAAAVFPHHAQVVAAVQGKTQMVADGLALVAQRHVPAVDQHLFLLHQLNPSFNASTFCRMRLR